MNTIKQWNNRLLYTDTFSAYSYQWAEEQGSRYQKQGERPFIQEAPCYLSILKNSLSSSRRLDQPYGDVGDRNTVERILTVFCDPDHNISAGDTLVVQHCGQVFKGTVGEPHKYACHQELLLYVATDA